MLTFALLLLAQAAAAEKPVLKADLKDVAAQGASGPLMACEGTTNLADGALIDIYLYYDYVDEGRAIAKETATVKGGKFGADLRPFTTSKKNFAGKYVGVLEFQVALQNKGFPGFSDGRIETELRIGNAEQFDAEAAAVRTQLAGEVQAMVALGDLVRAKIDELKDKPVDAWRPFQRELGDKITQIRMRADPRKNREYWVLRLDGVAMSDLEKMGHTLNTCARNAAAARPDLALEGITRLRQNGEHLVAEIAAPQLTSPRDIVKLIDAAKKLVSDALANASANPLPARRKFVEINSVLQKSLPQDFQPTVLEVGSRGAAFFNALSDKEPNVRELHAELDRTLDKLAAPLRPSK